MKSIQDQKTTKTNEVADNNNKNLKMGKGTPLFNISKEDNEMDSFELNKGEEMFEDTNQKGKNSNNDKQTLNFNNSNNKSNNDISSNQKINKPEVTSFLSKQSGNVGNNNTNNNKVNTNNAYSLNTTSNFPDNYNDNNNDMKNSDNLKSIVENVLKQLNNENKNLDRDTGFGLGTSLRIKNNPELERKYEELKEKYNQSEKEKNAYIKKFAADEKRYLDRINKLENIISASDKWDIYALEKQNNEYEMKISQLTRQVIVLQDELKKEKNKNNSFIGELMVLKQQLVDEVTEIKNFKISAFKKTFGNKILEGMNVNKSMENINEPSNNSLNYDPYNEGKNELRDNKIVSSRQLSGDFDIKNTLGNNRVNSASVINDNSKKIISKPPKILRSSDNIQ